MAYISLCRVCLSGDVKTQSIRYTPLQVIFEKLTCYELSTEDGRPETVCYICFSQLQRYHRLRDKSIKSEEILTSRIQILQETVSVLNRDIHHDFCITPIETYDSPQYGFQVTVKEESVTIKQEMLAVNTQVEMDETLVPVVGADAAPCRMCLSGDIPTHFINDTLQMIYFKLTNNKLLSGASEARVCYICRWQLIKCRTFIIKCKKSEKILVELFRNGIQLTPSAVTALVAALNRRTKTNFVTTPVESTSHCTDGDDNASDKHSLKKMIELDMLKPDTKPKVTEEQFKCDACAQTFNNSSLLKSHLRLHDPKRRYVCDICKLRYLCCSHLKQHKQTHKLKYKCRECNLKFIHKRKFNMHMLIHTAKNTYSCDKCDNLYTSRRLAREHKKKMHPMDKYPCLTTFPSYTCDVCNKKFTGKSNIRKHITLVHFNRSVHKCDVCGQILHSKTTFKKHLLLHTGVRPYECDICGKSYTYKTSLAAHIHQHSTLRPFACTICNKCYRTEGALKTHIKTHNKVVFTCKICNQQYSKKRYFDEHVQAHVTGAKTYACDKCGKRFSLNEKLKIHMYKHKYKPKEKKPLETCNICDKQITCLKIHMRTHTGEKPFKCDKCGKESATRGNHTQHIQGHTGLKPHSCGICTKSFAKKSYLKVHLASHSGLKPYACSLCACAFPHARQLSYHMRRHRDKVKYPCDMCDKTFNEQRSLDAHIIHTHCKVKHYVCDVCFKVYPNKKGLISHIKTHKKNIFSCELCEQSFIKMKNLARHVSKHIVDKYCVCPLCKKLFVRGSLIRHYNVFHGGVSPYACNVCEEGYGNLDKVYLHWLRTHRGETPYSCDLCEKSFKRNATLREHNMNVHSRLQ